MLSFSKKNQNIQTSFKQKKSHSLKPKTLMVRCPAKINLYLNTLKKYSDGFHEIESIFHAVSLYDDMEVSKTINHSQPFQIIVSKNSSVNPHFIGMNFVKYNLLIKVYKHFQKHYAITGVRVVLSKHIPIGAGLGGGSSNVAGLMVALNYLFKIGLSRHKLMEIGANFGSDVPFFFRGGMAWVGGRGEIVEKHPISLNQNILLTYPEHFLETAKSYQKFNTINPQKRIKNLKNQIQTISEDWGRGTVKKTKIFEVISINLYNCFQEKTLKAYPDLLKTYQTLKKKSKFSLMSGSGSSFFSIFHDTIIDKNFYLQLKLNFPSTFWVRLISSGLKMNEF